jgi:hypothetical protein
VAEAWAEVFRFAFDVTEHTRYSTYATWIVVVGGAGVAHGG